MAAVHEVFGKGIVQAIEKSGQQVAFEKDDVIGINRPDCVDHAVIHAVDRVPVRLIRAVETTKRRVGDRLVHHVVTGDGRIALVTTSDLLPQSDEAILELAVPPKKCVAAGVVAVPIGALPTRHRVQIKDGVQTVLGAPPHDAI
jgi:hypothetical protein